MSKRFSERLRTLLSGSTRSRPGPNAERASEQSVQAFADTSAQSVNTSPIASQLTSSAATTELNTMLLRCVRACQTELALTALARGADPNSVPDASERDQRSAIVLACVSPDLRLLRGLIAKGADLNRAHAGLIAADRGDARQPSGPPRSGDDPADQRCRSALRRRRRQHALHYAALSAQPIVAALLCDAAAPIDAIERDGLTPLGVAMRGRQLRCSCAFLLERGANPQVERAQPALLAAAAAADDDPDRRRIAAQTQGPGRCLRRARSHRADDRRVARQCRYRGSVCSRPARSVDLADARGTTALMEAARSGADDVRRLYLQARAPAADACRSPSVEPR